MTLAIQFTDNAIVFDDGKIAFGCVESCIYCIAKSTPDTIEVTISGVTNGTCEGCDAANGTYVCERAACPGGQAGCCWIYTKPSPACGSKLSYLVVLLEPSFGIWIEVDWCDTLNYVHMRWLMKLSDSFVDCGFVDLNVTPLTYYQATCNPTSASCVVTAL